MKHLYLVLSLFLYLSTTGMTWALPVTSSEKYIPVAEGFTYLNLSADELKVVLKWELLGDSGTQYFFIERKIEQREFELVGGLKYHSEKFSPTEFFEDLIIERGVTVTYRVRQQMADGSESYSAEVSIYIPNQPLIKLFPNPAKDVVKTEYLMPYLSPYTIQLIDINGRIVLENHELNPADLLIRHEFNVSHLPSGMYFFQISYGKQVVTEQVIKY